MLSFEDALWATPEDDFPPEGFWLPQQCTKARPSPDHSPGMLMLATDLAKWVEYRERVRYRIIPGIY